MGNIRDITEVSKSTHDEYAYQRFVSILRKKILMDYSKDMRTIYDTRVGPAFEKRNGRAPTGREIRKEMLHEPQFEAWSALRHTAQQMTWWSIQPAVERSLQEMIEIAKEIAEQNPAGGSINLDSEIKIPREVTDLDVHLMPGCFHTEYSDDDVAQGAVYHHGTTVFSGGLPHRKNSKGDVARSIANFVNLRFPDLKPKRILDLGCTAGANTLPYLEVFPDAEIDAIDVGAPVLRFAHARAEAEGKKVHFHQMNAETPTFEDKSFDLITSSFFFHEVSVAATKRIISENYRMLKPGGLMLHMELPPNSEVDPYYEFYLDWDAYYNNEPHYQAFRDMDFPAAIAECGFNPEDYVQFRIPNFGTTDTKEFEDNARGNETERRDHGNGAVWFTFGGFKK